MHSDRQKNVKRTAFRGTFLVPISHLSYATNLTFYHHFQNHYSNIQEIIITRMLIHTHNMRHNKDYV